MKLLADLPAVDVEEPHRRPVAAIMGGVAVLVVMLGTGLALLLSGDDGSDELAGDGTGNAETTVDLASWTTAATETCQTVAAEYPAYGNPEEATPAETEVVVHSLVAPVRDHPLPTDRDERTQAMAVVLMGDEAEQAWYRISDLDRDELAPADLEGAGGLVASFVDGLVRLGADCPSFR